MHVLPVIVAVFCAVPASARIVEVEVNGIIHPITVEIVSSAIAQAEQEHAEALLIRLSTPGGLMEATRGIVEQIFHSPIPVITWTGPAGAQAASAGVFLLEAGDVASMAPGTNTGAAHPVLISSQMDPVMKEKLENDAAALMRTIAARRGRNVAAAEKTVRGSASYTDREALDQKLIDVIAPDEATLLRQLEGREVTRFDGRRQTLHFEDNAITLYQPLLRQRVIAAIADPNIALMLLVLGALGVFVEFTSPGLIAPGVAGVILILLGLTAFSMLPLDWLGGALVVLGMICFALEAKFATHGLLTICGAVAMLPGALMVVNTTVPELRIRPGTALAVTLPFALISVFLFSLAARARHGKAVMGIELMVGQSGVAVGAMNPSGTILIRGEYWSALAPGLVAPDARVIVTGIEGLTLHVELAKEP